MSLADGIKQYYFEHIEDLPLDKQFHFASRVAAWQGDPQALKQLQHLKNWLLPADPRATLKELMATPPRPVYAYKVRKPYFDKYPELFGYHEALFRIRHALAIYDIDLRSEFLELASEPKLTELYRALINDGSALRILSRFAIDYAYLYEILFDKPSQLPPQKILEICNDYPKDDLVQTHLQLYLLTHTIVADSNFYAREIPSDSLVTYERFLDRATQLINDRYHDIKLDNKFEYLVASRLCRIQTQLFAKITDDAGKSLDPTGHFIIDRLVGDETAGLNGLARSEHRNVLFIMSQSPYSPQTISL